ncbi:MAG: peptide chain release factor N(5)-glutamine methyltransferase [Flavobacteriales bacterium]|nr:peptide chain release factor N(5)-glutamine methyltransferase [Flavobacteriales bacterium]
MDHATLRQHFYRQLTNHYVQGELQSLYHWCVAEIEGWGRAEAYTRNEQEVIPAKRMHWEEVIERLKRYEPVQYIFGKAYFHGLMLSVDASVLIPRPETEELVAMMLKDHASAQKRVLDVGTGSGCIALALKHARNNWLVEGVDVSSAALLTARGNASDLGLDVAFRESDVRDEVDFEGFDVIISNPPYIPTRVQESIDKNVLQYEPHLALFAPENDPHYFLRRVAEISEKSGVIEVYMESHATEEEALVADLKSVWSGSIEVKHDLAGRPRFLRLEKSE